MRWASVLLTMLVVLVAPQTWADFQTGLDAYTVADYATALKEWRPMAEHGDALSSAMPPSVMPTVCGRRRV